MVSRRWRICMSNRFPIGNRFDMLDLEPTGDVGGRSLDFFCRPCGKWVAQRGRENVVRVGRKISVGHVGLGGGTSVGNWVSWSLHLAKSSTDCT